MQEWKTYKIGEIGKVVGGSTPSTKVPLNYDGDIPWITPKDLSNYSDRYISRGERNITELGFKSCSCQKLPADSVLFSSRAPIGYVAIAKNEVCTNQGFKSIIPNKSIVDSVFLYYILLYEKENIKRLGTGTTFAEVSGSVMKSFELSLPPLPLQRRIASVLSSLDAKIETNRRICRALEEMAQGIFKEWFVDGRKEELVRAGEYISPKRGRNLLTKDAKGGKVPVVAGGLNPSAYHDEANTKAPVITISASGANAGFVKLWTTPVWSADSSYIDISITENVYFWYNVLKSKQKIIYDSQTGSAQPHIYPQHIENLLINKFDKERADMFNKLVEPLYLTIGNRDIESSRLASLRDTLLPKMMRGEITPKETETL